VRSSAPCAAWAIYWAKADETAAGPPQGGLAPAWRGGAGVSQSMLCARGTGRLCKAGPPRAQRQGCSVTSLRRRVAVWLIPPLALTLTINAVLSYQAALDAANRAYDRSITASVKSIAERIHSLAGDISVDIPYAAFDAFGDGSHERLFYAVSSSAGVLTGYADLPRARNPPAIGTVLIEDGTRNGEAIRLATLRKRLYDPALAGDDTVTIQFAETTLSRSLLARELFLDSVRRQLLLVAIGAALLLLAVRSAFRPLIDLRATIRGRDAEDLTPIPEEKAPSEVRPLIQAINYQMERVTRMVEARRRFLADAAHQIRTPLAVLTTQAEVGERQQDPAEMQRIFASQLATLKSTRRMADQMLTLSQAEPANGLIQERGPVELAGLVRDVALDLAPLALKKGIDLGFEDPGVLLPMEGNGPMLREMVANLIDNAIRYTPAGGHVTASVGCWQDEAVVSVCDDGPGIPGAERDKVFQRFYRILGHGDPEGSGLGLAIVREICLAHGGQISLKDGPGGRGLEVDVSFPRGGHSPGL
jgi:two-component system, OmpR family, sensor histidine kinase TctE